MFFFFLNDLAGDVLRVVVDTREAVPAEHTLKLADAALTDLRDLPAVPRNTVIGVHRIGRGSQVLEFFLSHGDWAIDLVAVAIAFAAYLKDGKGELVPQIQQTVNIYGGTNISVGAAGMEEPEIVPIVASPPLATFEQGHSDGVVGTDTEPAAMAQQRAQRSIEADADDSGWVQILGRFVSAFDGRYWLFRSGSRQYRLAGEQGFLTHVPTDRDVVVFARVTRNGTLHLRDWRETGEVDEGTLGQSSGRSLLVGAMALLPDGAFFTTKGGAVYRIKGDPEFLGNFDDTTVLADFLREKDDQGRDVIRVLRRVSDHL